MSILVRFRDWWLGQYRLQRGLGKAIWLGAPLLFTCCFCWAALLVVVPSPDVEPTAELAERAGGTVEVVATEELAEATAASTEVEPSRTVAPTRTTAPTRTAVPTTVPTLTEEPVMATAEAPVVTETAIIESAAPTRALFALSGQIDIISVDAQEGSVDLQNVAGEDIMLDGWVLRFEDAAEECPLDGVGLFPDGYTLRVWVGEHPPAPEEYSCGLAAGTLGDGGAETIVLADGDGEEIGRVAVEVSSRAVATIALPTAVPPTAIPPTVAPPTAVPQPTATLPTATGSLVITNVNKREEFVDIQNVGGVEVVLDGWTLRSEKGPQDCRLSGVLGSGQSLRIWAMAEDAGQGGFNCQFGKEIWNNSDPDAAVLINPEGAEVARR